MPYPISKPAAHVTPAAARPRRFRRSPLRLLLLGCIVFIAYAQWRQTLPTRSGSDLASGASRLDPARLQDDVATCEKLREKTQDPVGLGRKKNARFVGGRKAVLIRNATTWTGVPSPGASAVELRSGKAYAWAAADVLLVNGLVDAVAPPGEIPAPALPDDYDTYEAHGRPLTAGIVDMHSHVGVYSMPMLSGTSDGNELSSDTTPYLRSLDGLSPLDPQLRVILSGGVTTSLVLPGSGNNMGGEAFVIKHAVGTEAGRPELSVASLLAAPDSQWRYMKMACGENPKTVYGKMGEHGPFSRMGEAWEFRKAFDKARQLVRAQDDWCASVRQGAEAEGPRSYLPRDLEWESLAAVLRGQVQVHTHCYTVQDLEMFVGLTNEFGYRVRAFHHAHEAYLVPEVLGRAWGGTAPAAALFADKMYYKAESYYGSPRAGKVLFDAGITPVYVSDNPVINAQHVVLEAAKAYRHGLPYHAALAAVTSAPADILGLGNRLGRVAVGHDADVVVWDSDPLSLGAAPVQVWVDGAAQFADPVELLKPFDGVIEPDEALGADLEEVELGGHAVFTGVAKIVHRRGSVSRTAAPTNVVTANGEIVCVGPCERFLASAQTPVVHLRNGTLTPAFAVFGSTLGLNAINSEMRTDNGPSETFSRAADGLALDTKKLRAAYRSGVTRAVSAPTLKGAGTHYGTSVGFLTGSNSSGGGRAVWREDVGYHFTLGIQGKTEKTTSTAGVLARLRGLLLDAVEANGTDPNPFSENAHLQKVLDGDMPLILTAHSADTISAALRLKSQIESALVAAGRRHRNNPPKLRMVISGGAEAYLVAPALAAADVPVVVVPAFSFGKSWNEQRALTGAPLTNGTGLDVLLRGGVRAAASIDEDSSVMEVGVLAGWIRSNSEGRMDDSGAWGLFGDALFDILGLSDEALPFEDDFKVEGRRSSVAGEGDADEGDADEDDADGTSRESRRPGHFILWDGDATQTGARIRAVGGGLGHVLAFV